MSQFSSESDWPNLLALLVTVVVSQHLFFVSCTQPVNLFQVTQPLETGCRFSQPDGTQSSISCTIDSPLRCTICAALMSIITLR